MKSRIFTTKILLVVLLVFEISELYSQNEILENNIITPEIVTGDINLAKQDTLCISEMERAKKDIRNGKIVFTQRAGYLFGDLRYEKELKELCKKSNLVFEHDLISCTVVDGQTEGCYGAYMDKVIMEKYGVNFKENLHKKADSLFLVRANSRGLIIKYWDCDERPRLPEETSRTDDLPTVFVKKPDIKEKDGEYGGWPFFDIGFVIERDSSVSNFYIAKFVASNEANKKYKDELASILVEYIGKSYPKWVPGKIKGIPVRTDNNVRIYIQKKEE